MRVDKTGIDVRAGDVDDGRIWRDGDVRSDRFDETIANDDGAARDLRTGNGMNDAVGKGVDAGSIGVTGEDEDKRQKEGDPPEFHHHLRGRA